MAGYEYPREPALSEHRLDDTVHRSQPLQQGTLDRVGMAGIEVPVRLRDPATGAALLAPARAEIVVNLVDAQARGIHMSRLYLTLQAMLAEEELGTPVLKRILTACLGSHQELSTRAEVRLSFAHLAKRPALVSSNSAWRSYPVWMGATLERGVVRYAIGAEILYSSACPCSAALSRQATAERFRQDFQGRALDVDAVGRWLEQEQVAIGHSQRSVAVIDAVLAENEHALGLIELVDVAERALGTPVQAAVKREDEQEFARRNAENQMFCEDAARRLKAALDGEARFSDWRVRVTHVESLHPHDAVAAVTKGVAGGLRV